MSLLPQFQDALASVAQDTAIGAGELATALPRIVELAAINLSADGAGVWRIEQRGELFVCDAGFSRSMEGPVVLPSVPSSQVAQYLTHIGATRVLPIADTTTDPRTQALAKRFAGSGGPGALIGVPLRHRNQIVGVLAAYTRAARSWSEEEAAFVATLGDFVSLAIAANSQARVEAQLREQQDRVNLILSHVDAVIFTISPTTGEFEYMSPAVRRYTDTPLESVLHTNWQAIAHPDDMASIFNEVTKVYQGQLDRAQVQFRIRNDAGGWRWMAATTTVMRGSDGRRRVVGVAQDVTNERQRAQELAQLSQRVQEAQRLESIGQLAGGVAHDFNNLLTVILGSIDLAALQAGTGASQQLLAGMRTAAERAARLTRQLLAFSRRQVLQLAPVDVADVVTGMNALLRSSLPAHIAFSVDVGVGSDHAMVLADRAQLEQTLVSMTMNAAEAMPDGGQFAIRLHRLQLDGGAATPVRDAPPGDYIWLELKDTGRGINSADFARVFEPFFSTKPFEQGGGLGLAAVFGVVKQHQGHIDLDSTPGVGTTFHILLPALVDEVRESAPAAQIQAATANILVVEDEPAVRELAVLILRQSGHNAVAANDVQDALDRVALRGERYDLLVTDVIMPSLNGVDLYRRLQQLDPRLRVLYISGYAQDNLPAQIEPGALSAYLQKPFTLASLRDKVLSMLQPLTPCSS